MQLPALGKMLVLFGGLISLVGLALMFTDKIPFLGKLPGDINIKKDNIQIFFPVTTSILLSLLLSALFWFLSWISKK